MNRIRTMGRSEKFREGRYCIFGGLECEALRKVEGGMEKKQQRRTKA